MDTSQIYWNLSSLTTTWQSLNNAQTMYQKPTWDMTNEFTKWMWSQRHRGDLLSSSSAKTSATLLYSKKTIICRWWRCYVRDSCIIDSHTTQQIFKARALASLINLQWRLESFIFFQSNYCRCCLHKGWSEVTSTEDVLFPKTRFLHASHSYLGCQMHYWNICIYYSQISSSSNNCKCWASVHSFLLPDYPTLILCNSLNPCFHRLWLPFSHNS